MNGRFLLVLKNELRTYLSNLKWDITSGVPIGSLCESGLTSLIQIDPCLTTTSKDGAKIPVNLS